SSFLLLSFSIILPYLIVDLKLCNRTNKYIDEDLWNRLLSTYRMDSYENIWKSLFICHQLFREVSKEVAELLGFDYPEYGKNITRYTEDMYKKYVENDYF
ncbi:aminoglycoside 6-adenylyltransferase, partial [Enterococcus faecium]|uniref:aminoglycoside 6-adenylyltransferase n=1 Tax=Enterococcus faecium TaxID=1352 RepID=UPI00391DEC05